MSPECQVCNQSQVIVKKCKTCGITFCSSCGSTLHGRCKTCNRQYMNKRRGMNESLYVENVDDIFIRRSEVR